MNEEKLLVTKKKIKREKGKMKRNWHKRLVNKYLRGDFVSIDLFCGIIL